MNSSLLDTRAARAVFLVAVLLAFAGLGGRPASAATNTVVSLTFDDGHSSQYATIGTLSAHGMRGTYYINSAMVGSSSYYMTWPQIHDIANARNEIGGHTLHHVNLTTVSSSTATTEVCDDRTALNNQGFSPVSSFAYPEAAYDSTAEQIVKNCGYASARTVGDIGCSGCASAESIPPADAYAVRTPDGITTSTTLSQLESYVTNAENHGGGSVVLVFHGICDNRCTDVNSLSPSIFTAFLDWLQPRSASGTVVKTVSEVIGGSPPPPPGPDTTAPATTIACNGGSCAGWSAKPVQVTLSATDVGGSGVTATSYSTDGTNPPTIGYTTPFTVPQTTTVRFYSVDGAGNAEAVKAQTVQIDTVPPTSAMTSPPNASTVRRNHSVPLAATASDAGSGVASVGFLLDGSLLGMDTSSPYSLTWTPRVSSLGSHTLTAVATDRAGNKTTSAPITVTVTR